MLQVPCEARSTRFDVRLKPFPEASSLPPALEGDLLYVNHACNISTAILSTQLLQAGQDYSSLQSSLRNGDFQKADDITRQKLIELAGPGAVKRGWVYFTEVRSAADLLKA